jgi:hypothetical protein
MKRTPNWTPLARSAAAWALLLALGAAGSATGADETRVAVARNLSPDATLLQRQAPDQPWQLPASGAELFSRDLLLALPGARADIESKNKAVHLALAGNLPQLSPIPVLESAVVLHDNAAVDLDFTLERGRVILTSAKDKEPAKVRVRFGGEGWDLTLAEKGDELAVERWGRWPRGVPFSEKPKPDEHPGANITLLVLKGTATIKAGPVQHTMHAPPGSALFQWDSEVGNDSGPKRIEKVPDWALPAAQQKPEAKATQEVLARLQKLLADKKPVEAALGELASSAGDADTLSAALTRSLAVSGLAALDDLPRLSEALAAAKQPQVRETAIEALRNWIGRGPGQDQLLYNFLIKQRQYSPRHAEIVLNLLHTPFDPRAPETYETLIAYLRHDKQPVRELAKWHLDRLAPAGRSIPFDAAAPAEEREKAYKEWKKLIPDGKLPPAPPKP